MKKEQAKFIRDKFLNQFKDKFTLVDKDTLPVLEKLLFEVGLEFNENATKNLERSGTIDTGALQDLSAPQIYQIGDGYILEVGYPIDSKQAKYYDYINKGVTGLGGKNAKLKKTAGVYKFKYRTPSKSMIKAIHGWAKRASLSIKADKVDLTKVQKKRRKIGEAVQKSQNTLQLAEIISRAIKRDGIRATYYFDKAVKKTFDKDFKESLEVALAGDFIIQIRSTK